MFFLMISATVCGTKYIPFLEFLEFGPNIKIVYLLCKNIKHFFTTSGLFLVAKRDRNKKASSR